MSFRCCRFALQIKIVKMEQQTITALPAELQTIAQGVSVEKATEVQAVLNHVFDGVSKMRQQLDSVVVADQNDKVNMQIANTIRLAVKKVRLDAEKTFDAKRAEVQAQMLSYKTEDQLWLKAKQTMQILTKEIEEQARWKEETKERYEAEQKELKVQQRMVLVSKVAPEIPRSEFENMSDSSFDTFYAGLEKQYNDRIEAERIAEEQRIAREKELEEQRKRIEEENKRLKQEAEEKERALAEERKKLEAQRKEAEEKARKEREALEAKMEEERKQREKIEAELKAKAAAEEKAKREEEARIASELKAKKDAERKAKAAPDKQKLQSFATLIDNIELPVVKSEEAEKIVANAKELLAKVSAYIREKTELI